ncbi:MAG: DoxX family protein, partial [Bacteroidota bacterium]
ADLVLRMFAGLSMAFGHGLGKVPPSEGFVNMLDGQGLPLAIVFAWAAGLSEFLGGLFVAVGFATRPAALFMTLTMLYAGLIHHGDDPFSSKEKALLYAAIGLFYAIRGAGNISVDRMIKK